MSIAELIELLEKAEGPDRWLDAKIDAAFRIGTKKMRGHGYEWAWKNFPAWAHHKQQRGMCGVQHANGDLGLVWDSMEFTSSIDAALTAFGCALPGWRGSIQFGNFGGPVTAYVCADEAIDDVIASHPFPAIALCIAILKAKQAQEARA